jgi:hypothetical protein
MTIPTSVTPVDEELVLDWMEDQDLVDHVFFELVRTIRPPVLITGTLVLPPLRTSTAGLDRSRVAPRSGSDRDCRAWARSPPVR